MSYSKNIYRYSVVFLVCEEMSSLLLSVNVKASFPMLRDRVMNNESKESNKLECFHEKFLLLYSDIRHTKGSYLKYNKHACTVRLLFILCDSLSLITCLM